MTAYYNEIDEYAAQWLRNLITAGLIADGEVDTRSISDVAPDDLREFTQCHFFAGIGVWSHALRIAGWGDDRAVWTGSCPCQPFSVAGRSGGFADERHLWPHWHYLIEQCRPRVIFGEQVASKDGLDWLDLVHADLEGAGYTLAAFDLGAASVGAPHIRQRLFFVGYTDDERLEGFGRGYQAEGRRVGTLRPTAEASESGELADASKQRRQQIARGPSCDEKAHGREGRDEQPASHHNIAASHGEVHHAGPTNDYWRTADWIACRDGKWRPVEPGTFPLAHGVTARVGRLRAYGNAIVPQVAAQVITAFMEYRP